MIKNTVCFFLFYYLCHRKLFYSVIKNFDFFLIFNGNCFCYVFYYYDFLFPLTSLIRILCLPSAILAITFQLSVPFRFRRSSLERFQILCCTKESLINILIYPHDTIYDNALSIRLLR